jgi:hypothetical protein
MRYTNLLRKIPFSALVLVAALGMAAGPAAAQGPSIRVTEGADNNPAEFIGRAAVNYPMLQVAIENRDLNEPVSTRGLTLTASGTGDEVAAISVGGVKLYLDADADGEADEAEETQLGASTSFSANDGTVTFDFSGAPVVIQPGMTANFICVYNLNGSATPGQTFRLDLASSAGLVAVGANNGLAAVVSGPPVAGLAKEVGQGKLLLNALADLNNTPQAFFPTYAFNSGIRFKIDNTLDERVALTSISVEVAGSADDAALIATNGVRLQIVPTATTLPIVDDPDVILGEASISGDDGVAVITLNEPLEIARGAVLFFYVTVQTNVEPTQYFNEMVFSVAEQGVVANGLDSLAQGLEILGEGLAGPTRQYRGTLIEAAVSSVDLGDVFATPGSSDYPVLAFTMKTESNLEAVTLSSLTFQSTGTLNETTDLAMVTFWEDAGTRRGRVDREGEPGVEDPRHSDRGPAGVRGR